MAHLMVRHTVKDFAKWKPVFDEHEKTRKAAGSKGAVVYQDANNPNHVTIITEWGTVDQAKAFAGSPDLKAVMEKAGVVGRPELTFFGKSSREKY